MNVFDENIPKGMRITSGSVTLEKKRNNLIGISIGGGAPLCPALYVVQVFDNSSSAKDGTLEAGDELVSVNGISVKNYTRTETAKLIQESKDSVTINYNKLHVDCIHGKSCDINLKKIKHKFVDKINSSVADLIGMSRAILVNDTMVKKFSNLKETANVYKNLVKYLSNFLHTNLEMGLVHKVFGDLNIEIGIRELQVSANEAFCKFGKIHQTMEKNMINSLKKLKQVILNLQQFVSIAIPDIYLTIKKYLDVKFEYLAYCLKIKEMDDEEYGFYSMHESLYRLETGNYEYRFNLRCRQEARRRFAQERTNVLIKLDLLDNKYVQDITTNLQTLVQCLSEYHSANFHLLKNIRLFPIEIDIAHTTFSHELTCEDLESYSEEDSAKDPDKLDIIDPNPSEHQEIKSDDSRIFETPNNFKVNEPEMLP